VNVLAKQRHWGPLLTPLRDVEGVIGSGIWDHQGTLLAEDLPDLWGRDVLHEVGVRIAHLHEAFGGDATQFGGTTLVFAQHKLQLKPFGGVTVGVLMAADANVAALQMALNIAGRHLTLDTPVGAAPVRGSRASQPELGAAPQPSPAGVRLYRGQRVTD
jgi:hypothetical protein